jgi:alpha-ketoglutarate-dependent taurine dioxygenase
MQPSTMKLPAMKRRAVAASPEALVRSRRFAPGQELPLVLEPATNGVDIRAWARESRPWIDQKLAQHGGLLFRGFDLRSVEDFEGLVRDIRGDLLEYKERSSPRSQVAGNVYTSTDHPPSQPIFLHNENSYQSAWPLYIFFYCHTAPQEGGETPIADTRAVYDRLPAEVRRRFEKGWMYVRNFGGGFGLDWRTVFQTDDRRTVEEYCRENGIGIEWREGDRLRTRAIRPATAVHPRTGEKIWFNHATFFHVSTLEPEIRDALTVELEEGDLPANTYYADGSPIEPETLATLRDAYARETVKFSWQQGDLLMLDNMMVAHARAPFRGPRKILVAMAEPISRSSCFLVDSLETNPV